MTVMEHTVRTSRSPAIGLGLVVLLLGAFVAFTVRNADAGTAFDPPSTTTLVSSFNPSLALNEVVFTATVSPTPGDGAIDFVVDGVSMGSGPLTAGAANLYLGDLAVGTHAIVANFSGGTGLQDSTSNSVSQVVQGLETTTHLDASATSVAAGDSVVLTAIVDSGSCTIALGFCTGSSGAQTPAADNDVVFSDESGTIGSAGLDDSAASLVATPSVGTHQINAHFLGDDVFGGSVSNTVTLTVIGDPGDGGSGSGTGTGTRDADGQLAVTGTSTTLPLLAVALLALGGALVALTTAHGRRRLATIELNARDHH